MTKIHFFTDNSATYMIAPTVSQAICVIMEECIIVLLFVRKVLG